MTIGLGHTSILVKVNGMLTRLNKSASCACHVLVKSHRGRMSTSGDRKTFSLLLRMNMRKMQDNNAVGRHNKPDLRAIP